jgi:hypothetical protein
VDTFTSLARELVRSRVFAANIPEASDGIGADGSGADGIGADGIGADGAVEQASRSNDASTVEVLQGVVDAALRRISLIVFEVTPPRFA